MSGTVQRFVEALVRHRAANGSPPRKAFVTIAFADELGEDLLRIAGPSMPPQLVMTADEIIAWQADEHARKEKLKEQLEARRKVTGHVGQLLGVELWEREQAEEIVIEMLAP